MSRLKNRIINDIIIVEGGYVDDPSDSGGETNFGITIDVARKFGFLGQMKNLPRETAFDIYSKMYWDSVRADDLSHISEQITEEVVDTAVNMGVSRASKFLQRSLNVLNNNGKLYSEMVVDGSIGPMTILRLNEYAARRDVSTLVKMLNCLQGAFYIDLAERREKDERFIYGWFKNRVKI